MADLRKFSYFFAKLFVVADPVVAGAKKHEIYAAAFGDHRLFLQGPGGPLAPPGSTTALLVQSPSPQRMANPV